MDKNGFIVLSKFKQMKIKRLSTTKCSQLQAKFTCVCPL